MMDQYIIAMEDGDMDTVKQLGLINCGPNTETACRGLLVAAKRGHLNIVHFLPTLHTRLDFM